MSLLLAFAIPALIGAGYQLLPKHPATEILIAAAFRCAAAILVGALILDLLSSPLYLDFSGI